MKGWRKISKYFLKKRKILCKKHRLSSNFIWKNMDKIFIIN